MSMVNYFWRIVIALFAAAALSAMEPALPDPAAEPVEDVPAVMDAEWVFSAAESED